MHGDPVGGVIDRILAHVAPILRSGPITPVDDIAACPASPALRWRFDGIEPIGSDVLPSLVPA
jgi:diaminohydroxyphosphoribosylaminopyrimidine deaminase / 5-amino-6-(5-phosphoribosylamino)uracil reductase